MAKRRAKKRQPRLILLSEDSMKRAELLVAEFNQLAKLIEQEHLALRVQREQLQRQLDELAVWVQDLQTITDKQEKRSHAATKANETRRKNAAAAAAPATATGGLSALSGHSGASLGSEPRAETMVPYTVLPAVIDLASPPADLVEVENPELYGKGG